MQVSLKSSVNLSSRHHASNRMAFKTSQLHAAKYDVAQVVREDENRPFAGPVILAAVVALSAGLSVAPAFADDDLSPLERRQQESERRRQLLREAREKAASRAAEAAAAGQISEAEAEAAIEAAQESQKADTELAKKKLSTALYEAEAAKSAKAPPANPLENTPLNFSLPPPPEKLSDIKLELPKTSYPAPTLGVEAPVKKVEAPARKVEEPKKVVEAKKVEEPKKSGKRRGPLPVFLAQFLVLAMFGGIGAAATKYNEQTSAVLNAAGKFIVSNYKKVEGALANKQ